MPLRIRSGVVLRVSPVNDPADALEEVVALVAGRRGAEVPALLVVHPLHDADDAADVHAASCQEWAAISSRSRPISRTDRHWRQATFARVGRWTALLSSKFV